jgi:hypothetical protein
MDGMILPTTKRAKLCRSIEQTITVRCHVMEPETDWTEALCRDYWHSVIDKFRPGDRVEVHSFDHRRQFVMLILDCNAQSDPLFLDAVFLPVYPPDLALPELEPQRVPRYVVRQAPGSSLFNVVDTATGLPTHPNAKYRHSADELASEMNRALDATTAQIADALHRVEAASDSAMTRSAAAERTRRWREKQRAAAEAAATPTDTAA